MSTTEGPTPPTPDGEHDLIFAPHDFGREDAAFDDTGNAVEEAGNSAPSPAGGAAASPPPPAAFRVVSATPTPVPAPGGDDLPWIARDAAPAPADAADGRPWRVRHTDGWVNTSTSTTRRLRQEAVNLAWNSAWLAAVAAGRRQAR